MVEIQFYVHSNQQYKEKQIGDLYFNITYSMCPLPGSQICLTIIPISIKWVLSLNDNFCWRSYSFRISSVVWINFTNLSSTSVSGLVTCAYSDYGYVNFKIHWAVTRIQSSTHLKDESLNTLKRQTCDKKKPLNLYLGH